MVFFLLINYIFLLYLMEEVFKSLEMAYFKLQSQKFNFHVSICSIKFVHKYSYSL